VTFSTDGDKRVETVRALRRARRAVLAVLEDDVPACPRCGDLCAVGSIICVECGTSLLVYDPEYGATPSPEAGALEAPLETRPGTGASRMRRDHRVPADPYGAAPRSRGASPPGALR